MTLMAADPDESGSLPLVQALRARRPQRTYRIIDAHAHAGPYSLFFIPRNSAGEMVDVMDRCGVRTAIVSTNLGIQLDAAAGNRQTAGIVDAYPGRMYGYIVINPWQDPEAEIARWQDDPRFVGIKIHPDLHHYRITDARYGAVWEFAERTGRPVLTHTWLGSEYDDLAQVAAVAQRHPLAQIIAGHAGVRREGVDDAIALAREHPGVHLEICGSHGHGAIIARMVDELGSSRVLYGSDFPFIDMRTSLGRVIFAGLSRSDTAMVLGGNIIKLIPQLAGD
ncbi:MAG TPA: amidohydrolase family protein [Micromonosporaceae bacterium]|jgi:hypothetical protein